MLLHVITVRVLRLYTNITNLLLYLDVPVTIPKHWTNTCLLVWGLSVRAPGPAGHRRLLPADDSHRSGGFGGAALGVGAHFVLAGGLDVQLSAGHRLG